MDNEKGQALVELAVSLLLLLTILFGITEIGRYLYYANTANNAARDGVRWAVTHAEVSGWCNEVEQHILDNYGGLFSPALDGGNITVLIDEGSCSGQPSNGNRVHVIVSQTFTIVAGSFIPPFINKPIRGDASMRYEL